LMARVELLDVGGKVTELIRLQDPLYLLIVGRGVERNLGG